MSMTNKYDTLLVHLMNKIRDHYFHDLSDALVPIGASHVVPTMNDIEYAAMIASMMLLHVNKVEMETNFPDIAQLKTDVLKLLDAFDTLHEGLKQYRDEHKAEEETFRPPFNMGGSTFEA